MMATPRTLGVCGVPGCYGPHVFCLSLSPFSWLRRLCAGMAAARLSRRVRRAVPRPAAPDGGAVPPSLRFLCLAAVNARLGANTVIWGFPVMVCLVLEACGNFGPAFWARTECWRTAVKDSSSVVTGALSLRRRARACAAWLPTAAAALARISWVAVSQAQASEMTRRGDPERSTGPDVRFPAPVMVALSSPKVVSDALHLVR